MLRDRYSHTHSITLSLVSSLISGLISFVLIACTGSFEDGTSSTRLVFAITQAGTINCLNSNASTPVQVAVGLLIVNSNLDRPGGFSNCSSVKTDSAPYDLVTTPTGDRIIVSLPSKGKLEVRSNKANIPVITTLQPKDSTEAFCPTRLALSPDVSRVAVLDDPDDATARNLGCTNTNNRQPRVLVFNLTAITASTKTLEPIRTATGGASGTFEANRANGPFALAMLNLASDKQVFVMGKFKDYAIFKLNKDNETASKVTGTPINLTDLNSPNPGLQIELTNTDSRLLLAFSTNSGTGGAYFIDPNSSTLTPEPVALNGKPLTATTRAVWNKRPNDSLIAYLQPSNVIFQRLSSPASNSKAQSVSNPIDAAFTSDNYAWVLQSSGVSRFDTTNLARIDTSSSIPLDLLNARAIGTFVQQ
jgi:hypothetical protein